MSSSPLSSISHESDSQYSHTPLAMDHSAISGILLTQLDNGVGLCCGRTVLYVLCGAGPARTRPARTIHCRILERMRNLEALRNISFSLMS